MILQVMIGNNLASHISADDIEICEENRICMIFLLLNSTHLLLPLDVSVYGPMKAAWQKGVNRVEAVLRKDLSYSAEGPLSLSNIFTIRKSG